MNYICEEEEEDNDDYFLLMMELMIESTVRLTQQQ